MQAFDVFTEMLRSDVPKDEPRELIGCLWVDRRKPDKSVRWRLVCRGFREEIHDQDDIYASTPTLSSLKVILADALSRNRSIYTGDISVAFLHADVTKTTYVKPPHDYVPSITVPQGDRVLWQLNRAMYGLRSAPRSWQDHLVEAITTPS